MKVGPRVWKTALAVTIAILVGRLLGLKLPVFAGVAAIICMQPTIAGSLRKGVERMQATIIGALFSLLALMALDAFPALQVVRPAVIGLTVLVVMAVTLRLGWLDSLVLAAATVVVIMVLPPEENIYSYAMSRTVITFIGIVVASAVNAVFLTPRHSVPLREDMGRLMRATADAYRRAVEGFCTRRTDMARESLRVLADSDDLLESATTRMQWVEEEEQLRRRVPYSRIQQTPARPLEVISLIRHSTVSIAEVTLETLVGSPEQGQQAASIYETLWEIAQPGLRLLEVAEECLAGDAVDRGGGREVWTEELHKRFIECLREHRTEVYPLVESSVVEYEIRRATVLAEELAETTCGGVEPRPG